MAAAAVGPSDAPTELETKGDHMAVLEGQPFEGQLFRGKVAVVTGGGSGIGLATVRRLATQGASVVVVDLDGAKAEAAAAEVGGVGLAADVGDPGSWPGIVEAARGLGGVHLAHLNAGTAIGVEDIAALTDAQYRRITGVNFDGVVFGTRAVVPALVESGGGAIVATSSMAGVIPFPGDPIYSATKHAVVGLVRSLAPTLRSQGITVNAVCPSLVDTPLIDGPIRDVLAGAGFPLLHADEVAAAVVDLLAGSDTGRAVIVQTGMAPTAYRFARVPAPDPAVEHAVPADWRPQGH